MSVYSKNEVHDPISGQDFTIRGYDNAAQAQIAFATNQANYNLAQEQNQWNFEQWQRQNEYNSPSHQLQLLAQAGINPNTYSPQGMTAAQLNSADLSVAGIPQLTAQKDTQPLLDIVEGVGGVTDQILNTLNSIYNAENLKAGIAESKLRQDQAKVMNPLLFRGQELSNELNAEGIIQSRYRSKQEYYNTQRSAYDWEHYEEKFLEDLKLTKSSSYLNYQKAAEALKMIDQIDVTTDIQKWTRDFMQKTGVDPHSDGVSQLIQLMLSDPGHATIVIHSIIDNLAEAAGTLWDKINPFN